MRSSSSSLTDAWTIRRDVAEQFFAHVPERAVDDMLSDEIQILGIVHHHGRVFFPPHSSTMRFRFESAA